MDVQQLLDNKKWRHLKRNFNAISLMVETDSTTETLKLISDV